MSILRSETVQVIAETEGIDGLPEPVAAAVAADVEYRIREITQEAIKFMRHAKRTMLTVDDINNALRIRNVEALYGYLTPQPAEFAQTAEEGVFYMLDEKLSFDDILNQPLPPVPRDVGLAAHWLAVEGVQPLTPENPSADIVEAREAQEALASANVVRKRSASAMDGDDDDGGGGVAGSTGAVQTKTSVRHVLSKELQILFKRLTTGIISGDDEEIRAAALSSLRTDPGLHQLLPYLVQFIATEVMCNLQDLALLTLLMKMADAILASEYFNVEPYLHQLLPAVLTCLVGKTLCADPAVDDHWTLRDTAAELVRVICHRYGHVYPTLQPRVTRTLVRAMLDPAKPLATHYGAIKGLGGLGTSVTRLVVVPNLRAYMEFLEATLEANATDPVIAAAGSRCKTALAHAVGVFLHRGGYAAAGIRSAGPAAASDDAGAGGNTDEGVPLDWAVDPTLTYKEIVEIFGDALVPYISDPAGSGSLLGTPL